MGVLVQYLKGELYRTLLCKLDAIPNKVEEDLHISFGVSKELIIWRERLFLNCEANPFLSSLLFE